MKYIQILGLVLAISCNRQIKEQFKQVQKNDSLMKKNTLMEEFNKIEFNQHQKNGEWNFTDDVGNGVRQIKDGDNGYIVNITVKDSLFVLKKYFSSGGALVQAGMQFRGNGFLKGVWENYDLFGHVIKSVDYDAPYIFSWEKLLDYMKKNNVDMNDKATRVWRQNNSPHLFWQINYDRKKYSKNNGNIREVQFDGKTGNIINEKIIYNGD